ncbi:hypothetical protein JOQ06_000651 [Pogonophryne albipinna]|uniref:Uncharacterized protein n=1 Tax=Pogonophryne albipinna TaxID=1090488 RepID=A0AAD6AGU1_9TELE|nr:hypothetical protein JOQ06_000651 [Pogonophryne albipinna]
MRILLPTQTRFVTPGSTELHFYSDRHVRDRVRLHLRRVTENNNTKRRTRETTTAKISSVDRTRPRYGDIRKVTEVAELKTHERTNTISPCLHYSLLYHITITLECISTLSARLVITANVRLGLLMLASSGTEYLIARFTSSN